MADKFEKFTERARKVLTLAQEEAHRFNHNYIGTEHLLLGLVREGDGVAARVLANMGVEPVKLRSAVEFIIGRGDSMVVGEIGLTPRAKKVIELAVDEARRLNHHYIGTEHLLLGLVREGEGIGAGILASMGVNLEKVRQQVLQVVGAGAQGIPPPQRAHRETQTPLGELRRVLAVNQTQEQFGVALTILSLEEYKEGAIIHGLVRPEQPPTPVSRVPWMPHAVEASDELGTRYLWSLWAGYSDAEALRFSLRLAPALNLAAHSLRLQLQARLEPAPDAAPRRWAFELEVGS